MYKTRIRGRRLRRGGAMLELALLLPVYMLIFFVVWTFGNMGLMSSQAHLGSRYAAWKRAPASPNSVQEAVAGGTFMGRVYTGSVGGLTGYAHQPENQGYVRVSNLGFWGQHTAREMYSYVTYDLAAPLPQVRMAKSSLKSDESEPSAKDAVEKHSDSDFVGNTLSQVSEKFPTAVDNPKDFGYSEQMLATALEGDGSYGDDMPWLVRHVSRTGVTAMGVGGVVHRADYLSTHTVLLGIRYHTAVPNYYDGNSIGVGTSYANIDRTLYYNRVPRAGSGHSEYLRKTLRNTAAFRQDDGNTAEVKGGRHHQLHFMKARDSLSPKF